MKSALSLLLKLANKMTKFFRNKRLQSIDSMKAKSYLLYAFGEILLIMIGILMALKVNNLNNARLNSNLEIKIYQKIKDQLLEDKAIIESTQKYNLSYAKNCKEAIGIIESKDKAKMQILAQLALDLTKYSDFDRPGNISEIHNSNGELKLISNKNILKEILLVEESYNYFNRMEEINYDIIVSVVPELVEMIKYSDMTVLQPDKLYDYKMQNIFITALNIVKEKDQVYQQAIDQINEIVSLVDKEI